MSPGQPPSTRPKPGSLNLNVLRSIASTKGFAQSTCKHPLAQGEGGLSSWPNVACGSKSEVTVRHEEVRFTARNRTSAHEFMSTRLVRSFQPFFQRDRIVMIFVARGIEERDRIMLGSLA
jgi:hypothetical protein